MINLRCQSMAISNLNILNGICVFRTYPAGHSSDISGHLKPGLSGHPYVRTARADEFFGYQDWFAFDHLSELVFMSASLPSSSDRRV